MYVIILLSEYQNKLSLHLHWPKFSTTPSIFQIHKNSNLKDFWKQIRILGNSNSNLIKPWFLLELARGIVSAKIWPKWSFSCFFHRCCINSILNLQMQRNCQIWMISLLESLGSRGLLPLKSNLDISDCFVGNELKMKKNYIVVHTFYFSNL